MKFNSICVALVSSFLILFGASAGPQPSLLIDGETGEAEASAVLEQRFERSETEHVYARDKSGGNLYYPAQKHSTWIDKYTKNEGGSWSFHPKTELKSSITFDDPSYYANTRIKRSGEPWRYGTMPVYKDRFSFLPGPLTLTSDNLDSLLSCLRYERIGR